MFRRILVTFALGCLAACAQAGLTTAHSLREPPATGAAAGSPQELMSKLVGRWVLRGTIAHQNVVHDVEATWHLQGNYVRINEISRERGDNGGARYEATIYVGWLESAHRYACIWLDNTEVASGDVTCTTASAQDSMSFEFRDARGALLIATTFVYHVANDTWDWRIDNVSGGHVTPFAALTMHRR